MRFPKPKPSSSSRTRSKPPSEVTREPWKPEKLSAIILGLALAIGAWLRFHGLGAYELTRDEGGSWFSAIATSVSDVVRRGSVINVGKLPMHDLALHFWILAFGDSVISMRSLSAILGIISIPLVFLVARELLECDSGSSRLPQDERNRIAAVSALVFALSLPAIHYSREARVYALLLAVVLAQVWFFLRGARSGRFVDLLGAGFLSALSVAASLVNAALLVAQGVWLLALLGRSGRRTTLPLSRRAWILAVSLIPGVVAGGLMVLTNPSGIYWQTHAPWQRGAAEGFIQTARMAPLNAMCALTIGLAVWGTIRCWREASQGVWFVLLWMWLPVVWLALSLHSMGPLFLVILSFWFPCAIQRYVLTCVVPFSILVAMGIGRIRSNPARLCALALFVGLAMARVSSYYRSPWVGIGEWGREWREAVALAAASEFRAGRPITVYPPDCSYVAFYYARNQTSVPPINSPWAHPAQFGWPQPPPNMITPPGSPYAQLVIDGSGTFDPGTLLLHQIYSHRIARFFGISVAREPEAHEKEHNLSRDLQSDSLLRFALLYADAGNPEEQERVLRLAPAVTPEDVRELYEMGGPYLRKLARIYARKGDAVSAERARGLARAVEPAR